MAPGPAPVSFYYVSRLGNCLEFHLSHPWIIASSATTVNTRSPVAAGKKETPEETMPRKFFPLSLKVKGGKRSRGCSRDGVKSALARFAFGTTNSGANESWRWNEITSKRAVGCGGLVPLGKLSNAAPSNGLYDSLSLLAILQCDRSVLWFYLSANFPFDALKRIAAERESRVQPCRHFLSISSTPSD